MTDEFTRSTAESHDAARDLGGSNPAQASETPQPNGGQQPLGENVPQPEPLTWSAIEQPQAPNRQPSASSVPVTAAIPWPADTGKPGDDAVPALQSDAEAASAGMETGLASLDPLIVRPRASSWILCLVLACVLLLAAGAVWWLGVRTLDGQSYDEMVFTQFTAFLPSWLAAVIRLFTLRYVVLAASLAIGALAVVVAIARKRWWMLLQMLAFAVLAGGAALLKYVLPRPYLINIASTHNNSAPSGHTILAAAACVMLLFAVARAWRAVVAAVGFLYTALAGLSVIAGGWHRPVDVVMALLAVAGLAMLTLAWTRASGMDEPGKRASSASVQIASSVLTTAGILACLYAAYVIWQVQPGLALSDRGIQGDARISAIVVIAGVSALLFGLGLGVRQLTASPLSKIGLVGAPPLPPLR